MKKKKYIIVNENIKIKIKNIKNVKEKLFIKNV